MDKCFVRKPGTPVMERHIADNGMEYLTFPLLDKTGIVSHAFSTRIGGVSKGYYGETNFSFTRGDVREHVEENYRMMAEILGFGRTLDHFVTTFQTHTTNIRHITSDDMGKGVCRDRDYTDVDGIITDEPDIILTTFHADCPPVYFVDPVHKAIGLAHSGWKGTVGKISARMVEAMCEAFGSNPDDLICAIGPSICVDCYEVSSDVADEFIAAFCIDKIMDYTGSEKRKQDRGISSEKILYRKPNGKYQLNLWSAITRTLKEAGVKDDHIQVTDICTKCNPDYLFSHRATGDKRGNLAAFLSLK